MTNNEIANIFKELADLLDIKGENHFKVRACRNAARVIASYPKSIHKMVLNGEDLTKLPAIGESIAKKINKYIGLG